MALKINGVDGSYDVPRVLQGYKFTPFEKTLTVQTTSDAGAETKSIDVKRKVNEAWRFVTDRAAKHQACNEYFKTLFRQKSLKEVLEEGDIVLHLLEPKPGHAYDELPDANTAGRDIGIDPGLLLDDSIKLSCTLIHELAHVAGATTDKGARNALAAESSLRSCLCAGQFRKESLGRIEQIGPRRGGDRRIV